MNPQFNVSCAARPDPLRGLPLFGKLYLYSSLTTSVQIALMQEQVAMKSMNEEQTASLKTALLH